MANEATVRSGLSIRKDNLEYISYPSQFLADVAGVMGPVPGALIVPVSGINIDFTGLTQPALCWMINLDETNFVTVGVSDPETVVFYPILELLPGECYAVRLSRNLSQELGTGTGTIGPSTNTLQLRADTASCNVRVEAFEV